METIPDFRVMSDMYKLLLTAAITFLIGSIITLLTKRFSQIIFKRIASKTKTKTDDFIADVIIQAIKPLGFLFSASISWSILPIENAINSTVLGIIKLISIVIIIRIINKVFLKLIQSWALRIDDNSVSTMLRSLSPMVRALVWCIGIVFYLQNLGVQMAAIWALLSAGGIGAGLALKEPVQEFFEYITILLDKPFENGQFIHVDGVWASVDRVGVRSTRLRSLNGEIIVMSNSLLTGNKISNYGEMEYRRIVHRLGVVYETSHENMTRIPKLIESIIEATDDAVFDRCHFIEFGKFSLDFEVVYYIPTNNYLRAMEAQQAINLGIMQTFEKEAIAFAFPTQTLHVLKD